MKVEKIMSRGIQTIGPDDSLNHAAQLMWEHDFGCLPVTDGDGRVIGMITDRDICMAAYTQGGDLSSHPVSSAMSRTVYSCSPDDSIRDAEAQMRGHQVRRLPVVEDGRAVGILSLNDIALAAAGSRGVLQAGLAPEEVLGTLSTICDHRSAPAMAAE